MVLSLVVLRTLALCDLERFAEAEETLLRYQHVFEECEDAHTGATLCALRGRIALGLDRLDEAEAAFTMARDELLALGRHYDAALASLDLAETYLRQGKGGALRALAGRLVRSFKDHGVERELLMVLQLLARHVAVEGLTAAALNELRQQLTSRHPRAGLPDTAGVSS